MTKVNFLKFSMLSILSVFVLSFYSCVEDEIEGCMDVQAENYNPNAVVDSGDCTYAADDLIGSYLGTSQCGGTLTNPGFNTSSLMFAISTSDSGIANDVKVSFSFETEPFIFNGEVNGNELTINDTAMGVNFPNPADPTATIVVDVEATGTMTYFDDDMTIDCQALVLKIKSANSGATIEDGTCTIIGTKQ